MNNYVAVHPQSASLSRTYPAYQGYNQQMHQITQKTHYVYAHQNNPQISGGQYFPAQNNNNPRFTTVSNQLRYIPDGQVDLSNQQCYLNDASSMPVYYQEGSYSPYPVQSHVQSQFFHQVQQGNNGGVAYASAVQNSSYAPFMRVNDKHTPRLSVRNPTSKVSTQA